MMDIALLLLATVVVGAYILWPALKPATANDTWEFSQDDTPAGRLATRKEVLVGNIADLDFEFAMGKLGEEDYRSLRDNLKRQTLKVMEQLEVVEHSESRVSRRVATKDVATEAKGAAFCSACGTQLPARAAFCPSCGTAVSS